MGCNYYLRPKGFEHIDELNKDIQDKLNKLQSEYIDSLKSIVDSYTNLNSLYLDLVNISDPEDIDFRICYIFDSPDVHICKLSMGWIPLFESTKFYDSWNTFENFYLLHSKDFDLIDECNEVIDFAEFKERVFNKVKDKKNQTHLVSEYQLYGVKYWKDSDGVEWTNSSNWS